MSSALVDLMKKYARASDEATRRNAVAVLATVPEGTPALVDVALDSLSDGEAAPVRLAADEFAQLTESTYRRDAWRRILERLSEAQSRRAGDWTRADRHRVATRCLTLLGSLRRSGALPSTGLRAWISLLRAAIWRWPKTAPAPASAFIGYAVLGASFGAIAVLVAVLLASSALVRAAVPAAIWIAPFALGPATGLATGLLFCRIVRPIGWYPTLPTAILAEGMWSYTVSTPMIGGAAFLLFQPTFGAGPTWTRVIVVVLLSGVPCTVARIVSMLIVASRAGSYLLGAAASLLASAGAVVLLRRFDASPMADAVIPLWVSVLPALSLAFAWVDQTYGVAGFTSRRVSTAARWVVAIALVLVGSVAAYLTWKEVAKLTQQKSTDVQIHLDRETPRSAESERTTIFRYLLKAKEERLPFRVSFVQGVDASAGRLFNAQGRPITSPSVRLYHMRPAPDRAGRTNAAGPAFDRLDCTNATRSEALTSPVPTVLRPGCYELGITNPTPVVLSPTGIGEALKHFVGILRTWVGKDSTYVMEPSYLELKLNTTKSRVLGAASGPIQLDDPRGATLGFATWSAEGELSPAKGQESHTPLRIGTFELTNSVQLSGSIHAPDPSVSNSVSVFVRCDGCPERDFRELSDPRTSFFDKGRYEIFLRNAGDPKKRVGLLVNLAVEAVVGAPLFELSGTREFSLQELVLPRILRFTIRTQGRLTGSLSPDYDQLNNDLFLVLCGQEDSGSEIESNGLPTPTSVSGPDDAALLRPSVIRCESAREQVVIARGDDPDRIVADLKTGTFLLLVRPYGSSAIKGDQDLKLTLSLSRRRGATVPVSSR